MRLRTAPILLDAVVVLREVPMLADDEHIAGAIGERGQIELAIR
jgi:hypothetical protein